MVSFKLTIIAMFATLTVAAPFPGPGPALVSTSTSISTSTTTKPFSFSQWVDDILNPNVVALTPEQALEAYYQSINGTSTSTTTSTTDNSLSKRAGATCETNNSKRMPVADAVYIVNTMAAGGQTLVHMPERFCSESICHTPNGRSAMVGQKDCLRYVEEPSEYWARAGGLIMDACTWGDMSGGKIIMPANQYITVLLWGQGY